MKRIEREWTPSKASGVLALLDKLGVKCGCATGAISCLLLPPCEKRDDEWATDPPHTGLSAIA